MQDTCQYQMLHPAVGTTVTRNCTMAPCSASKHCFGHTPATNTRIHVPTDLAQVQGAHRQEPFIPLSDCSGSFLPSLQLFLDILLRGSLLDMSQGHVLRLHDSWPLLFSKLRYHSMRHPDPQGAPRMQEAARMQVHWLISPTNNNHMKQQSAKRSQ